MTEEIRYQDKPWLANYEEGISEKVEYEQTCLPEFLERTVEKFPGNTALIFQGKHFTDR